MNPPKLNNLNNKEKIKKLINKGLFDDHIDELSEALYTKRIFTKDIRPFFNKNKNSSLDNYLTPKNKKISHDIKLKLFDKYNEEEINEYMQKLLTLLNNSQEETHIKFNELKEENEFFNSLYKIYKNIRKINSIKDNNLFLFLYDLLIKYKSYKNLEFDMSSLFSDVLKETPLATKEVDKLKFYYILNSERFDNIDNVQNLKSKNKHKINPLFPMSNKEDDNFKMEIPKEPKVIDVTKIKNLKEVKYLNKVNRRTKYKIITGGKVIGVSPHKSTQLDPNNLNFDEKKSSEVNLENSNEGDDDNIYNFQNYEDVVNEKEEEKNKKKENRKQLKLDIEKDIIEINRVKETIKNSFKEENNDFSNLKNINSNLTTINKKLFLNDKIKRDYNLNLNNNKNKIKKMISLDNDNKRFKSRIKFNPITNKDNLVKTFSFEKFKTINEKYKSDIFNKNKHNISFVSNNNNYQASTYYSNMSNINNNSSLSYFSLRSSKCSNLFNSTPKKNTKIISNNLFSPEYKKKLFIKQKTVKKNEKNKILKKSKSIYPNAKRNELLKQMLDNNTEDIYLASKKINGKNYEYNLKKINDYLKYKNSKLPLLYGNSVKDTFLFLRRIKNEILNIGFKNKYQNIKKFLNDKEKKKIKDIDLLESNIISKEKEFLVKVLKNKI